MFCDICGERDAVIHVTRVINGKKSEVNLCETCAGKYKDGLSIVGGDYFLDKFLLGIINSDPFSVEHTNIVQEMDRCPTCGLTLEDYQNSGRLGCGECYEHFASKLEPIFKRIHGSTRHQGKRPEESVENVGCVDVNVEDSVKARGVEIKLQTAVDSTEQELARLKKELKEKVELEEFETAAILRDEIQELELQFSEKMSEQE